MLWIRSYKYPVYEGIWRIRDETEWYTSNANVLISLSSTNTYVNECSFVETSCYIYLHDIKCAGETCSMSKEGFTILLLSKQLLFSCLLIKVSFAVRRPTTMRSHKWRLLIQSIAIKSHPFPAYSAVSCIECGEWNIRTSPLPSQNPNGKRAHQAIKMRII